ncbi:DUF927 domain-containing protein [Macrococcus equi]|uniref:DUF927 domain-containing protein n=1 Tax=Macrococcus equi TaxID=3395462 RepID=UPI0039BE1611
MYSKTVKEVDVYKHVSRNIPYIVGKYRDVETDSLFYIISFNDGYKKIFRRVKATAFTRKSELLELSTYGLDVSDNNYKSIMLFLSMMQSLNDYQETPAVTRIGHINEYFIIPNHEDSKVKLFLEDSSYQDMADNFKRKGTLEGYKSNVFNLIRDEPTALVTIYGALGSVLLKELDVEPFIVDLSGKTSTGKTTILKLASSVWGKQSLVNSWNSTAVAIERKASFYNSFPLFMDDTRAGSTRVIGNVIYNHSVGHDKGRGNITGVNKENKWHSILISTGENAISEYAGGKAGASARAITLEDEPFKYPRFNDIYKAINSNYGTLGIEFYNQFKSNKDKYLDQYNLICKKYHEKSNKNEVLERLSRAFALLELTGMILSDIEGFQHDYSSNVERAYKSMLEQNRSIDKPKELLIETLEYIDANRDNILYDGQKFGHGEIVAIHKDDYLGIMPQTIKKLLEIEMQKTVKEWNSRGYLVTDKEGRQKVVKQSGRSYRTYAIKNKVIEENGFDFTEIKEGVN